MSMHLTKPSLTLIRSRRSKLKLTKAKLKEYQIDLRLFNKDRKKHNEPLFSLDDYIKLRTGRLNKKDNSFKPLTTSSVLNSRLQRMDAYNSTYRSLNSNGGSSSTSKKEVLMYTGERKLLGIATMHKSNMVPVFDSDDAKDLARMRRN